MTHSFYKFLVIPFIVIVKAMQAKRSGLFQLFNRIINHHEVSAAKAVQNDVI